MKNMSFKVAVGYALPNQSGASYHLGGIPAGYARVGVDEVVPLYANLDLDIPGGDGEKTLGEVEKGIALWNKKNIVFPNLAPRPPTPPSSSPPPQDPSPHLKIHPPKIHPPHIKIHPSTPRPSRVHRPRRPVRRFRPLLRPSRQSGNYPSRRRVKIS